MIDDDFVTFSRSLNPLPVSPVKRFDQNEKSVAVGQLAAGLAHELRNPLASIKLLVQAARERESAVAGRDLEVLEEEILRLERLLQTFLDYARPPRLEKKPVVLREVIESTVDLVRRRAEPQKVQIDVACGSPTARIEADADQLRQVLLNLLLNAVEALPQGGLVSVFTESPFDGEGSQAVVRIRDNGPGLPPELGPRIFEPFVSTKETGIGLGLSLCRQIVQLHGGTIEAANRHTGGAEFVLRLPATSHSTAAFAPH